MYLAMERTRSVSNFGLSVVNLYFEDDVDIYFARQVVGERLQEAREQIPEGYGDPRLAPITTGLGEIYQFELRGEPRCRPGEPDTEACYSLMELRSILDWVINYQLRSVPGEWLRHPQPSGRSDSYLFALAAHPGGS